MLFPIFESIFNGLKNRGQLESFRHLNNNLLIALDGLQYHSSSTIKCGSCSEKHHKNGKMTYSHEAITPVIVNPSHHLVISLEPEFITPQDGHQKQDCETAAAKRWIAKYASRYRELKVTILGDDLYKSPTFM